MRILVVTTELHQEGSGGGGIYVYEMCKELVRQGHDVEVITSLEPRIRVIPGWESRSPFKIHDITLNKKPIIGALAWSIKACLLSSRLIRTKRYGVVSVQSPFCHMYPVLYCGKVPLIATVQGGFGLGNPRHSLLRRVFHFLRDLASFMRASTIIVLNHSTRHELARWGISQEKIAYVPNGVEWERFVERSEGCRLRKSFRIPKDAIVVLYLGRIDPSKGVEMLLDAVQMIAKIRSDIWTMVAGDGPLLPRLAKNYAHQDNVVFTGFLSQADKTELYKESDLFVFPSQGGEGMPTVLLEAMASGLPIISTRVAGAVEIVENGFGRLVPCGDATQLAEAILELTRDRERLRTMGFCARKCAERYDWSIVVQHMLVVFETASRSKLG